MGATRQRLLALVGAGGGDEHLGARGAGRGPARPRRRRHPHRPPAASPPRVSRARRSIRQAVSVASGYAAHSSQLRPAGRGSALRAGTTTRSAWPPHRCSPRIWNPGPSGASLPRATMSATGDTAGLSTTSSPGARSVTLLPTDSTTPGHVAARHVRQRGAGLPTGEPQVHVVQGARPGGHPHVVGPRLGVVDLAPAVGAGRLVEDPGVHGGDATDSGLRRRSPRPTRRSDHDLEGIGLDAHRRPSAPGRPSRRRRRRRAAGRR